MLRRWSFTLIAVLAVAAAVGTGWGIAGYRLRGASAFGGSPGGGLVAGARTRIVGDSSVQRRLLREILTALGPTEIRQLRVVRVPGGVDLEAPGQAIRAAFEVWVVGAAFFYRSADQRLPPVVDVSVGRVSFPTSNAGRRPTRATASSVVATRRMIHQLAVDSGAQVMALAVSAPDALAVELRVRVGNAASFLQDRLRALVIGARAYDSRYDGLFVEVDDVRGVVWASASTPLGGEDYVRPSLSGCNPFPPPSPSGQTLRGCPR
jgi:hypothetical protein